jgi:hypothetical protein
MFETENVRPCQCALETRKNSVVFPGFDQYENGMCEELEIDTKI